MKNQVKSEQIKILLNTELKIAENDPVRFLNEQLEELDYTNLYRAYSNKTRSSQVDPSVMFKIIVFAYSCGIYTSRKIEEACNKRIDFIWLLDGQPTPDHCAISRFRTRKKSQAALEDLFYQYVQHLEDICETEHGEVFIDGTKLESKANKYTFVWKKVAEKSLAKTKEKAKSFLQEAQVEGNVTKQKVKTELDKLNEQITLENIVVKRGRGHHKPEIVRKRDLLQAIYDKWNEYEQKLKTCGDTRNSYAKTDLDATFMHMKEDHMRNSQLKPGYNVQFCVNSEYITGLDVFSNRTDYGTLIPLLQLLEEKHGVKYQDVVADAGYESLSNYRYLQENGYTAYIKPNNYKSSKTRKFKAQIGRVENMAYYEPDDCFICKNGQHLDRYAEYNSTMRDGTKRKVAHYRCEDCTGCPYRTSCCKAAAEDTQKEVSICWELTELRKQSLENITTLKGKKLRVNRSIQVEGAFGQLKNNRGFRRFLTKGNYNVKAELYFLALSQNVRKYHSKCNKQMQQTHLFAPATYLKF